MNSFLKSSTIYLIGSFILKGISFLTLPIFTRLMLPDDYAMYSLYSATLGILMIFIGMQIQGTVNLAFSGRTIKDFESYVSNISVFPLIGLLLGIILFLFIPNITDILMVSSYLYVIILMIQAFFGILTNIYMSELIIKKQPKKHLIFSLIATISNVLLSIGFVLMIKENTYFGRVLGGLLSNLFVGIYILILYLPRINWKNLKKDWKYGLSLSLPLIFHNLSGQLLNVADRYMLSYYSSEFEVALYSICYNIGLIIQIIWLSINNAWVPWYFESLKAELTNKIRVYCKQYITFFSVGTIIFLYCTPELTVLMAGQQYKEGIYITPFIAVSYFFVFLYSFYVNYEFYKENTKIIPIATLIAVIINIILNIYSIPQYGIYGAAISTIISYFVMFICHYFIVTNFMKHRDFPSSYIIISIIFVLLNMIISYIFIEYFALRFLLVIVYIIIYVLYLKIEIKKIIK